MTSAPAVVRARRGRPLTFEPCTVLDRVVDAFWVHGYGPATMGVLERASGVSRSSLLNTFGTKEELFAQALDRYQERVDAVLVTPLVTGRGGLLDVLACFELLTWPGTRPPGARGCMIVNVSLEWPSAPPAVSVRVERYRTRLRDGLTATLHRAVGRGELDPCEVPRRVEVLVGLVVAVHWTSRVAGPAAGDQLARSVARTVESWLPEPPGDEGGHTGAGQQP